MYAVTFDIDTNCLGDNYHTPSSNNAYADIRKFIPFCAKNLVLQGEDVSTTALVVFE